MLNPLAAIYKEVVAKAMQDSETGSPFHPEDLSQVMYLDGSPPVKFLQRLKNGGQVNGSPHRWKRIVLGSPTGTSRYFYEGDRPDLFAKVPTEASNTIFQCGGAVKITDKEAALYANPGGYQLQSGESMKWFKQEMALQMTLETKEVLQEMDYIFIRGDKTLDIPASLTRTDVQCDGLLKFLVANTINASASDIDEDHLIDLAEKIHLQYTGRDPDTLWVTTGQQKIINTWTTFSYFNRNSNLAAGKNVNMFNTGFFEISIVIEPFFPSGQCSMVDHTMFKKKDLIALRAEGLSRTDTALTRMLTYYGTLECGNDVSSGQVYGLNQ